MRWLFLLVFACQALISASSATTEKKVPPVILVPGDGGSQIEAKLDKPSVVHYICSKKTNYWFDLWLNMELLVPEIIDCWVDNMRLVYDNVTRTTSNSPGVSTRVPGFGNTNTVEWLDPSHRYPTSYFYDVVQAMVTSDLGYKRGVTIKGAPFDFRKAPNELHDYFEALRNLTEQMHADTGQRVVFLLHSMGGPVTWYFLGHQSQAWKDKHVEAVVSLAGAWGGSIKAVKVYTAGDNLGIYLISPQEIRAEQRSAPSLAFLLPSPHVYNSSYVFVQTPKKNYTTANLKELFEALRLSDGYDMYMDTKDLLTTLGPPGVELYCLYGHSVDTVAGLKYEEESYFPDKPKVLYGDGDGTVNIHSAQVCTSFKGKQKAPVHGIPLDNIEHMAILKEPMSIKNVMEILHNITLRNEKAASKTTTSANIPQPKEEEEFVVTSASDTGDSSYSKGDAFVDVAKSDGENSDFHPKEEEEFVVISASGAGDSLYNNNDKNNKGDAFEDVAKREEENSVSYGANLSGFNSAQDNLVTLPNADKRRKVGDPNIPFRPRNEEAIIHSATDAGAGTSATLSNGDTTPLHAAVAGLGKVVLKTEEAIHTIAASASALGQGRDVNDGSEAAVRAVLKTEEAINAIKTAMRLGTMDSVADKPGPNKDIPTFASFKTMQEKELNAITADSPVPQDLTHSPYMSKPMKEELVSEFLVGSATSELVGNTRGRKEEQLLKYIGTTPKSTPGEDKAASDPGKSALWTEITASNPEKSALGTEITASDPEKSAPGKEKAARNFIITAANDPVSKQIPAPILPKATRPLDFDTMQRLSTHTSSPRTATHLEAVDETRESEREREMGRKSNMVEQYMAGNMYNEDSSSSSSSIRSRGIKKKKSIVWEGERRRRKIKRKRSISSSSSSSRSGGLPNVGNTLISL